MSLIYMVISILFSSAYLYTESSLSNRRSSDDTENLQNGTPCVNRQSRYILVSNNCSSDTLVKEIKKIFGDYYINLKMTNITFPRATIHAHWLTTPNILIDTLFISDEIISDIEPNAFNSIPFNETSELELTMPLKIVRKGLFNGMLWLVHFTLHSTKLHTFETDAFRVNSIPRLQLYSIAFNLTVWRRFTNELVQLNKTTVIAIQNNRLLSRITNKTFSSFTNLRILNLEFNRIIQIENGSFDAFADTISYLNLKNNLLKTLPDGLFRPEFFTRGNIGYNLYITNNPWNCSCDLLYVKTILIKYSEAFLIKPVCQTPARFYNHRVDNVELCNEPSNSDPNVHKEYLKCRSENNLPFKIGHKPMKSIRVNISLDGNVQFIFRSNAPNYAMFWDENMSAAGCAAIRTPSCIVSWNLTATTINFERKLDSNKIYRFCLMTKSGNQQKTFNCIATHTFGLDYQNIWLRAHTKKSTLIFLFVVCLLGIFFGAAGTIIIRKKIVNVRQPIINKHDFSQRQNAPPLPPLPKHNHKSYSDSSNDNDYTYAAEYVEIQTENHYLDIK